MARRRARGAGGVCADANIAGGTMLWARGTALSGTATYILDSSRVLHNILICAMLVFECLSATNFSRRHNELFP